MTWVSKAIPTSRVKIQGIIGAVRSARLADGVLMFRRNRDVEVPTYMRFYHKDLLSLTMSVQAMISTLGTFRGRAAGR